MAEISGIEHVNVTVRDVRASAAWNADPLGLERAWEEDGPEHGWIKIGLYHAASRMRLNFTRHQSGSGEAFSEFRTGVDLRGFVHQNRRCEARTGPNLKTDRACTRLERWEAETHGRLRQWACEWAGEPELQRSHWSPAPQWTFRGVPDLACPSIGWRVDTRTIARLSGPPT